MDRIDAIRSDVFERGGSFVPDANPFLRDVALWRGHRAGASRVENRAAFLRELVALAPLSIGEHWRIAGEHLLSVRCRGEHTQFHAFELAGSETPPGISRIHELGVTEGDLPGAVEIVRQWVKEGWRVSDSRPGSGLLTGADTRSVYDARGWSENHSIRDFARVLREGFASIRAEAVGRIEEAEGTCEESPGRGRDFWHATVSVCDAAILLGRRYSDLAAALAGEASEETERSRLEAMASACARVPAEGARTFAEAVQSLWLCHVLSCGEDFINANSIGRLDRILGPYYEADIAAGALTRDEAVEMMAELACKLYLEYDVQAITLGGVDSQGADASGELTYAILDATEKVGFVRDLLLRLHRCTPRPLLERASQLIIRGGGIPFVFNDECFIPALTDRGISLLDARDYAPIGCIELTIPGKASPHAVSGVFNAAKCLELALHGGRDPATGEQVGPPSADLESCTGIEDVWGGYRAQVEHFARAMVEGCSRGEESQRCGGALPCLSTLTDQCIERGRDITDGGAVYTYHSVCLLGTANVADSVAALEEVVFRERTVSAPELLHALRTDFKDHEPLRQQLLRSCPKYGNGDARVDDLARRVDDEFIDLMDTMKTPMGSPFFVHLFSFRWNLTAGKSVGATPDGRHSGEPIAYSLSAQQGRDEGGVTAMLQSLARLPHHRAAGASAAIVEIDPSMVAGPSGAGRMADLLAAAVEMGIGQLQWNVVSADRLRLAQEDPERWGGIEVRVAGYSQRFRLIDRELQDHIIARTKHAG